MMPEDLSGENTQRTGYLNLENFAKYFEVNQADVDATGELL
jgi:hypothetical protein